MNILMSGAGGFIGRAAAKALCAKGHRVVRLVRPPAEGGGDSVVWEPSCGRLDTVPFEPDAVVHLAGENIFGRWTEAKKRRICNSRIQSTTLLAERLAVMSHKPMVLVCASAVGFYGHRGDVVLTEAATSGEGFLCTVCRDWEAAAESARRAGIRTVSLRFGMVLAAHGGAMAKMLPVFRMGLGGTLGDGCQWTSWVALTDAVRALEFVIQHDTLDGPVNIVAPQPVRNAELTQRLGHTLHRPALLPVPSVMLRLILGDFANEALLADIRAVPEKLLKAGFSFHYPALADALTAMQA